MALNILNIITSVIFQAFSYFTVTTLMVLALITNSEWFSLAGIVSTILISTINSHMEHPDVHNILMQFLFWLAEWALLLWFQRATLSSMFQDLPAALSTCIIVISTLSSIVFLEIAFHGIIGHTRGDLGTFGGFHTAIGQWAQFAWAEVRQMWDIVGGYAIRGAEALNECLEIGGTYVIRGGEVATELLVRLCRICGVRDRQEHGAGDLGKVGGVELQDQAQASSPPLYWPAGRQPQLVQA